MSRTKKYKSKTKLGPARSHVAVQAWNMSGAGHHGDKRKAKSKKACRGKVKHDG